MILVLGKGISGEGVHRFLNRYGIDHDYLSTSDINLLNYQLIVKSPGIRYDNPIIQKALDMKIKVITDIELISMMLNRDFVAITGTNGKTTVTRLIDSGLSRMYNTQVCGNIGYSIGDCAIDSSRDTIFVCELSSFQLKGTIKFKPHVSVILNIAPAHIDYHQTFNDYINSKLNITKNQKEEDFLICSHTLNWIETKAKKYTFSKDDKTANCYIKNNFIFFNKKKQFKVKTMINPENILAAFLVFKIFKVKNKSIKKTFKQFKGVDYRLQLIRKNIYNDAKSTNINSTINALEMLSRKVHLICGGKYRNENLSLLDNHLKYIKKVYAYGETRFIIKEYFDKHHINCEIAKTLDDIISYVNTKDTILYSPMFASYDQFTSFEERGKLFTDYVLQGKLRYSKQRNHS